MLAWLRGALLVGCVGLVGAGCSSSPGVELTGEVEGYATEGMVGVGETFEPSFNTLSGSYTAVRSLTLRTVVEGCGNAPPEPNEVFLILWISTTRSFGGGQHAPVGHYVLGEQKVDDLTVTITASVLTRGTEATRDERELGVILGSLDLDAVEDGRYVGSFELHFQNGDVLSGKFDLEECLRG